MHSSTALLWAIPSLPDPSQKKPVQSARNPATSVLNGLVPQHFGVANQKQSVLEFGAFRPDEFALRADQTRAILMQNPNHLQTVPFEQAAKDWLADEELYHLKEKSKTLKSYADYIKRLNTVFGAIVVSEIHIGHIREYQRLKIKSYHPRSVNHDLRLMGRILKKAGLWKDLKEHYRPLPEPKWTPPRVLTDDQEQHLFEVAARNEAYSLAYWVASLTNNTSASGVELRFLQRKHVHMELDPPELYIPEAKNNYRERKIPLNERGAIQMQRILDRAESLCSTRPEHFVFPFRLHRGSYDPTKPASESWLRKQWDKMRKEAGFPWLRPHDMRHQIVTKLLEDGQPEEVVRAIAGHVSREMMEHYSHTRTKRKFQALQSISPKKKPASISTGKNGKGASA